MFFEESRGLETVLFAFCFGFVNLVTLFLFWFPVMVADDFSDGALDGPG